MSTATTTTTTTTTVLSGSSQNNDASYVPRGPVEVELTFYVPPADGTTPFNYVGLEILPYAES